MRFFFCYNVRSADCRGDCPIWRCAVGQVVEEAAGQLAVFCLCYTRLVQSPSIWTEEKIEFLRENYPTKGKLWCCEQLNLKEHQVRYKAAQLVLRVDHTSPFFTKVAKKRAAKLKGRKRPAHSEIMKQYAQQGRILSHERPKKIRHCTNCNMEFTKPKNKSAQVRCCSQSCAKARLCNKNWNGHHPKGMLGKKHSQVTKQKLSMTYKKIWADPKSKFNSSSFRQATSDRMSHAHRQKTFYNDVSNPYSRSKAGWWDNGDKRYYMRSSWEHNYAWYLEWLKARGEIKDWEYEPDTFWFENIRRGVRSYLPDFKVVQPNGSVEYHEVKGWLDPKSKTKLARMAKYYPQVKMVLIDNDVYKSIKKWGRLIPGWE